MKKLKNYLMVMVLLCGLAVQATTTPPPLPDLSVSDSWTEDDWDTFDLQKEAFLDYMATLGYEDYDIDHADAEYMDTYLLPEIFVRAKQGLGPETDNGSFVPYLPYYPEDETNLAEMREFKRAMSRLKDYLVDEDESNLIVIERALHTYIFTKGTRVPTNLYGRQNEIIQKDVELPEIPVPNNPVDSNPNDSIVYPHTMTANDATHDSIKVDEDTSFTTFLSNDSDYYDLKFQELWESHRSITRQFNTLGKNGSSRNIFYSTRFRSSEQNTEDNEHISYGVLAIEEQSTGEITSTVFFRGSDPISASEMSQASSQAADGVAIYRGDTVGSYYDKGDVTEGGLFEGDVTLVANIEDKTINGNVYITKGRNIENTQDSFVNGKEIVLEETEITNNGKFAGSTNAGTGSNGMYHGEFYNYDSNTGTPGEVGGLYRALDSDYHYLGAFGLNYKSYHTTKDNIDIMTFNTSPLLHRAVVNETLIENLDIINYVKNNYNINEIHENLSLEGIKRTVPLRIIVKNAFSNYSLDDKYVSYLVITSREEDSGKMGTSGVYWGVHPVSSSDMNKIKGVATYTSKTLGAYHLRSDNNKTGLFEGNVRLEADFEDETISGEVSITGGRDFDDTQDTLTSGKKISLIETNISEEGKFVGTTNAGRGVNGKYKGEFFSNTLYGDGNYRPKDVGGIYSATDSTYHYLGSFGGEYSMPSGIVAIPDRLHDADTNDDIYPTHVIHMGNGLTHIKDNEELEYPSYYNRVYLDREQGNIHFQELINGTKELIYNENSTVTRDLEVLNRRISNIHQSAYITNNLRTTDHSVGEDDYISYGFLMLRGKEGVTGTVASVYFGGPNPFSSTDMDKVSGVATYQGETVGTYHYKSNINTGGHFEGDVSLTANLGNETISGEVNITGGRSFDDKHATFNSGKKIDLQETIITDDGRFAGVTDAGIGSNGEYHGEFHNIELSDNSYYRPGEIGGLYKATDNTYHYQGAFGAVPYDFYEIKVNLTNPNPKGQYYPVHISTMGNAIYDDVKTNIVSDSFYFYANDGISDTIQISETSNQNLTKYLLDIGEYGTPRYVHLTSRLRTSDHHSHEDDHMYYGFLMMRDQGDASSTASTSYFWGPNAVSSTDMDKVSGIATYQGGTVGTYHYKSNIVRGGHYEGDVSLTADLDNETISGEVNITGGRSFDDNHTAFHSGKKIDFEETNIQNDGHFIGIANAGNTSSKGKYYGQFHNLKSYNDDNDRPGEVGGLYKTTDDTYHYQGSFGATFSNSNIEEIRNASIPNRPVDTNLQDNFSPAYTISMGNATYEDIMINRTNNTLFLTSNDANAISLIGQEIGSNSHKRREHLDIGAYGNPREIHYTNKFNTSNHAADEDNHISYGFFMTRKKNAPDTASTSYFWGPNPISSTQMNQVSGSATFTGGTVGTYHYKNDTNSGGDFTGNVSLTANFDNKRISGEVNITGGRSFNNKYDSFSNGKKIDLKSTSITDDGRFAGYTNAGTDDHETYNGEFHNLDTYADGDRPGEVGGLYRATDNSYHYQGSFGAIIDVVELSKFPAKPQNGDARIRSIGDNPVDRVEIDRANTKVVFHKSSGSPQRYEVGNDSMIRYDILTKQYQGRTHNLYYDIGSSEHTDSDTDYVTYGSWANRIANTQETTATVFYGGANPISSTDMNKVSGTASYSGGTRGTYHYKSDTNGGGRFNGDVSLNADFDDNTLSGNVNITSGIGFNNRSHYQGANNIALKEAAITDDGRFAGLTDAGNGSGGIYHGEFYNYDSGNQKPTEVGGLYEAEDKTFIYQGAFGADKD